MSILKKFLSFLKVKYARNSPKSCKKSYIQPEEIEIALKEREASLRCAQEIANLGSWDWDYQRNKLIFSDEMYRIFGMNKENFQGSIQYIVLTLIHPDYRILVSGVLRKITELGIMEAIEFKIMKLTGEERWIRANGALVYDDENRKKIIGTVQDVTEWKEAEIALQDNLKFLQTLIDTIPNPIFYKDINGVYKYSNTAHLEYLNLKREDVIGHNIYDILPKEMAEEHYKVDAELLKNKDKMVYDTKLKYADDELHDVIFTKAAFTNQEGQTKGIVGVIIDITERKKAEKSINRLLQLKEAMLEINHAILEINSINELFALVLKKVVTLMKNADLACVLVLDEEDNLKIAACTGYDEQKSKDYRIKLKDSFIWQKTKGEFEKTVVINDVQEILKEKFPSILENTEGIEVQSSMSAPIIIDGELYGLVNVDSHQKNVYDQRDLEMMEYMRNQIEIAVSKHKLYEQTIYLSRYDKLTNVYNRRYFEEVFDMYMKRATRYKECFLVVVFDLNGLKFVNDTYGHLAGDLFIKTFAKTINDNIRASDLFARYGGDEFIGVFFEVDLQVLVNKFEGLIEKFIHDPIVFGDNKIICSFSYGIADFPNEGKNYKELVKIADERMYIYKDKIKKRMKDQK
ncbi:sensor domain-containing diguanylate cyclase [Crassaminicella profunda]|uniref:sensor domain-containing diguanylate cyclase n=1 Tax=Crassaminicella profunda TaxID=1286698 RepID=UPI001CA6FB70|nr:diguanylate cyclase [Crassaminicella profunda]QZY53924.1 diguanylate cyclase [Crassaminicella profunda]